MSFAANNHISKRKMNKKDLHRKYKNDCMDSADTVLSIEHCEITSQSFSVADLFDRVVCLRRHKTVSWRDPNLHFGMECGLDFHTDSDIILRIYINCSAIRGKHILNYSCTIKLLCVSSDARYNYI